MAFPRWKTLTIFLSSSFRGMHAERDCLLTTVFPEIEERLLARRWHLQIIDLRGTSVGGPDPSDQTYEELERKADIRALQLCRSKIDQAQVFVALLGDRHGWMPDAGLVREAGFSTRFSNPSVTALEIEHAVWISQSRPLCLIYRRQPPAFEKMRKMVLAQYCDTGPNAEVARAGLKELKQRLDTLTPQPTEYSAVWSSEQVVGLEEFRDRLVADIDKACDQVIGAHDVGPKRDRDALPPSDFEIFFAEKSREFQGRSAIVEEILRAVGAEDSTSTGICITGGSGSGKSALIAHLYQALEHQSVGGTAPACLAASFQPDIPTWDEIAERWAEELIEHGAPRADLGTERSERARDDSRANPKAHELLRRLSSVSARRRVILLVDAAELSPALPNQLADLVNDQVRIVVACRKGATADAFCRMPGMRGMELPPLSDAEARDVAEALCRRYHKIPPPGALDAILMRRSDGDLAAGNPLWLQLALQEASAMDASRCREIEMQPSRDAVAHAWMAFVAAMRLDVDGMFAAMLDRVERAFPRDAVRAFTTALALSSIGFRESDLLKLIPALAVFFRPSAIGWMGHLLGRGRARADQGASWSIPEVTRLRRALGTFLHRRGDGIVYYAHSPLRDSVLGRTDEVLQESGRSLHAEIVAHLGGLPVGDPVREAGMVRHMFHAGKRRCLARYLAGALTASERSRAIATIRDELVKAAGSPQMLTGWLDLIGEVSGDQRLSIVELMSEAMVRAPEGSPPVDLSLRVMQVCGSALSEELAAETRRRQRALAAVLQRLGDCYSEECRDSSANLALKAYRDSLANLAHAAAVFSDGDTAEMRAWRIAEAEATEEPGSDRAGRAPAVLLDRMAKVFATEEQGRQAVALYLAALRIHETACERYQESASRQKDRWVIAYKVGDLLALAENHGEILAEYSPDTLFAKALEAGETMQRLLPNDLEPQLYTAVANLAWGQYAARSRRFKEARGRLEAAIDVFAHLCARFPLSARPLEQLGIAHASRCDVACAEGQLEEAREHLRLARQALDTLESHSSGLRNTWARWHSGALIAMATLERAKGDRKEALRLYAQAVELSVRLSVQKRRMSDEFAIAAEQLECAFPSDKDPQHLDWLRRRLPEAIAHGSDDDRQLCVIRARMLKELFV